MSALVLPFGSILIDIFPRPFVFSLVIHASWRLDSLLPMSTRMAYAKTRPPHVDEERLERASNRATLTMHLLFLKNKVKLPANNSISLQVQPQKLERIRLPCARNRRRGSGRRAGRTYIYNSDLRTAVDPKYASHEHMLPMVPLVSLTTSRSSRPSKMSGSATRHKLQVPRVAGWKACA